MNWLINVMAALPTWLTRVGLAASVVALICNTLSVYLGGITPLRAFFYAWSIFFFVLYTFAELRRRGRA